MPFSPIGLFGYRKPSKPSRNPSATSNATITPTTVGHMPATVTRNPEPQILYEHCVRPSNVKTRQSYYSQAQVEEIKDVADKSVQTEPPAPTQLSSQSNEEVHTDISEASSIALVRDSRQSPMQDLPTTRSESRDSLNTWPPTTPRLSSADPVVPLSASVRWRGRQPRPSQLPVTRTRGQSEPPVQTTNYLMIVPREPQRSHNMPLLEWSAINCWIRRAERPMKRAFWHLSNFLLFCTLVLLASTLLQCFVSILHDCP